jgi:prolyl 4-hydroxylase
MIKQALEHEKIVRIDGFITEAERIAILDFATNFKHWGDGSIIDDKGNTSINYEERNSKNHVISPVDDIFSVTDGIKQRVYKMIYGNGNEPIGNSGFDLVKYGVGGDLKIHSDYFRDGRVNNRKYSVIIYIKKPTKGGGTKFPNINLDIVPNERSGVIFDNLMGDTDHGNVDMMHIGEKVEKGTKIILVMFINRY